MSLKGCWTLRRKVSGVMESESMATIRARFPLGYTSYVCQILQFGGCM
jgi:hypothetical protein